MSKKAVLIIDTSRTDKVKVGVEVGGKRDFVKSVSKKKKAQVALVLVEKILKKNHLQLSDIIDVKVNCGPGSFTGLRVGVSIANTLGTFLNTKINGKKNQIVLPIYE